MGIFESIIAILSALAPVIAKLINEFILTSEQKKDAYLKNLPARLSEIVNENAQASKAKDPSVITGDLNRG